MPALDPKVIEDLTDRLSSYLDSIGGYDKPRFLDAGGSAAVYQSRADGVDRAFKIFCPIFLEDEYKEETRRRLHVQKRLISHDCESLIQTYRVEEAQGTAILEMEYVPWRQLKQELRNVPDESVVPLISQLVDAVRFLEKLNIVHRDIKPENINVSPDFSKIKLLDLGVAREFNQPGVDEAAITDHGFKRPFLATAQYSSPEYLFRLDEPTKRLWQGLNYYQVGAVLHDLIMKRQIFDREMESGNRWNIAKAVLTRLPSFDDHDSSRLRNLKSLSTRCLTKDLDTRLSIVDWDDFLFEDDSDNLSALQRRLSKSAKVSGGHAEREALSRLVHERQRFIQKLREDVGQILYPVCSTALPLTIRGDHPYIIIVMAVDTTLDVVCSVKIDWLGQLYERMANVSLSAIIVARGVKVDHLSLDHSVTCCMAIDNNEGPVNALCDKIAQVARNALDLVDITEDKASLCGCQVSFDAQMEVTK